jgi:hypothetical protein
MLNFKKFQYRLPDSLWRLPDSPSRGVVDSPTCRVVESATPRLAESESRRLPDSASRGVVFRLRISPRIRSQKRNGSEGSVRDLWGPNFCKNPRKSASLPCPFNDRVPSYGIAAGEESQAVAGGVLNSPSSSTTSSQVALQMDDILGDFPHRYVLVSELFSFSLSFSPLLYLSHLFFTCPWYIILLKHHLHEIYCYDNDKWGNINIIKLLQCVISEKYLKKHFW